jgi:hypothetical protein
MPDASRSCLPFPVVSLSGFQGMRDFMQNRLAHLGLVVQFNQLCREGNAFFIEFHLFLAYPCQGLHVCTAILPRTIPNLFDVALRQHAGIGMTHHMGDPCGVFAGLKHQTCDSMSHLVKVARP